MSRWAPSIWFGTSCLASMATAGSGFGLFSYPGSHLHMTSAILGGLLWLTGCVVSIRSFKLKQGLVTVHILFLAIFAGLGARFFDLPAGIHHGLVYLLLVMQVHVTVRVAMKATKKIAPEQP